MISLVGSLVFGFTVGSSVVTSPIVAKIGYRYSGLGTVLKKRQVLFKLVEKNIVGIGNAASIPLISDDLYCFYVSMISLVL